ncbi:enolase C-terminal domain-like protein [Geobacter sp.]|uniref:mandelate racemase/muconate lactonizing enzyme family protein n=1 Tax=Geobacter sp. TaxID=46610 RepID=UPI0026291C27|nr:enolase C-terminal domain-like protein [Geobacter sp.]
MAGIAHFELFYVDLPFRKPFVHAAAERTTSGSLMLKCVTTSGQTGFGECLPRPYVSGESRDGVFDLLASKVLPRLKDRNFTSFEEVLAFLRECDGKAPPDWVSPHIPQTAAWAAVDLALLDAFGREFQTPVELLPGAGLPPDFRYSVVFSATPGFNFVKTAIAARLRGFRQVKLKLGEESSEQVVAMARRVLGPDCDIRVDANMAWDVETALRVMPRLARYGVRSFEQPLAAADVAGLARLVRETGLCVMVDESLNDAESLETLIAAEACTAVNVRISKCGGVLASYNRCRRALEAGLTVQVGCQVGESSLLSAAQLILIAAFGQVTYGEGCFGRHLLRHDPVEPLLQFGYGGRPPKRLSGPGLGVSVIEDRLRPFVGRGVTL